MAASKSLTPEQRSLRSRAAAHARWSREKDRKAATAKQRAGFMARFEREVDPDNKLDPATRAKLAESAMKAYMAGLAYKASRARSRKAGK